MYARVSKNGTFTGFTSRYSEKNCVTIPIKPLVGMESAKLNESRTDWIYTFEEESPVTEETPFILVDYQPASLYFGAIRPMCGDVCLEKSENISVLIPCYMKSKYIKDCVESCVNQTMKPSQIVVMLMDEESIAMKNELEAIDDIVECVVHDRVNVSKARTLLVEDYCDNDWFVFVDGDDMLNFDFIEECYKEEGSLIFTRLQAISANGDIIGEDVFNTVPTNGGHPSGCIFGNMTVLMHRDVFDSVGLDESLSKGGEDFDFFVRLLENKQYKVSLASNTCYYYRQTMGLAHSNEFFESHLNAVNKNLEFLHSEFVAVRKLNATEDYFYNNPTLEDFGKLFKTDGKEIIKEKIDNIRYNLYLSKQKTPMTAFSNDEFVLFGNTDNHYSYEGLIFDVMFVEELSHANMCNPNLGMVINKAIAEDEEFQKLDSYNRVQYLLKNYACFEERNMNENIMDDDEIMEELRECSSGNSIISKQFEIIDGEKVDLDYSLDSSGIKASFVLHKTCNLDCEYCSLGSEKSSTMSDDEIFDNFDSALTQVEDFADENNMYVIPFILGGEPTLWSDYLISKIANRMSGYRQYVVFSNGHNSNSKWYDYDNVLVSRHVVDWKTNPNELLRSNLKKNEVSNIVITHGEVSDFENVCNEVSPIYGMMSGCANSTNPELDSTIDDIIEINDIISRFGIGDINSCESIKNIQIDCNTMGALPCCRQTQATTIEDALVQYLNCDKTKCDNCVLRQIEVMNENEVKSE